MVAALLLLASPSAAAGDEPEPESQEGSKVRMLPVPIILTEPAIGRGLGVSLTLIHPSPGAKTLTDVEIADPAVEVVDGRNEPPDVTAVFGAYTEADSWAAGLVHAASWRADRMRYVGALMATNMNSKVYIKGRPLDFRSRGDFLLQDLSFRLGSSPVFLGARLKVNRSDTSFKLDLGGSEPVRIGLGHTTDVGLAVRAFLDSRDTTFTPSRGQLVNLNLWRHDRSLGGDYDYWKTELKAVSFHPLTDDVVLGVRAQGAVASGDPPFWGYPWVSLRGVPAMRYQDERVLALEAELRWNVLPRWALVGFFGGGATGGDLVQFDTQDPFGAGGLGGRYLFAADLGLWIGGDIARGPEETVWYIQVGHAW